jgi:maltose/moltooligosaccharide transporter
MLKIQKKLTGLFYVVLGLPATAMGFGLSIQIAVLSWILTEKYGLDIHEVGIVWAAGPIAGILGQLIIGAISDKIWFWGGRRKPFIIIGGVLAALMIYLLPRLDLIDTALGIGNIMAVAITVALTLDLSINVGFNPTRSIIADVTPEGEPRTKAFSWMQSISNLFGAGAYLISALVGNYTLIYIGVVLILAFTIIPSIFIEEPTEMQSENESHEEDSGMGEILKALTPLYGYLLLSLYGIGAKLELFPETKTTLYIILGIGAALMVYTIAQKERGKDADEDNNRSYRKLLAAHSFTWLGVQTMFVYAFFFILQKLNSENNEAGKMVGWAFFALNGFGSIFLFYMIEPLTKRIGRVKTHIIALMLMTVGYFGIAYFTVNQYVFYAFMVLLSIGWASLVSLPFAVMTEKINKAKMGLYMGIFNLSVVLPQLVASFILGKEIELAQDKSLIFIISGICLLISSVLWVTVKDKKTVVSK